MLSLSHRIGQPPKGFGTASREFEGAFSMINQQMVEHLPANFVYINREEDLGLEGLRKAK